MLLAESNVSSRRAGSWPTSYLFRIRKPPRLALAAEVADYEFACRMVTMPDCCDHCVEVIRHSPVFDLVAGVR